ncbi:MAG: META domain-containing protein [Euzebya sp.]
MRTLLFLVALPLALLGCGEVANDTGVPAARSSEDAVRRMADLSGTRWESVDVTGYTLPEGAMVRLEFDGDRFLAQIDCNHMAAPYTIEDQRLIVVYESTTETSMACPRPQADADAWFLSLIASQPQIEMAGDTMTIGQEDSRVVMELVDDDTKDGAGESSEMATAGPGTDAPSPDATDPDEAAGVTNSYSSPVIRTLAAAGTDNGTSDGVIVHTSDALADAWHEADVQGTPPALPDDHVGVLVIARVTQSTCRSPEDVLNVEISGGHAVVRLHPDGEFTRPCPGPPGSHAWTAFIVAIPEEHAANLATATVQLAESASE